MIAQWKYLLLGLAALALTAGGYIKGHHDAALDAQVTASTLASEQRAALESERSQQQTQIAKVTQDAQKSIDAANAAAIAAGRSYYRLHQSVTDTINQQSPGTATAGTPNAALVRMLADLFRRADERAGSLAAIADHAIDAGNLCAAQYDALTVKPSK